MTTSEREVTAPTRLCGPDGRTLVPEALGWSRTPQHTCNLRGGRLRTKRWDYWAVLTGDLAVSVTYADIGYLGMASVWWADLSTGATGGREVLTPAARGIALPDRPGTTPLRFRSRHLDLDLVDDAEGTRITGRWGEKSGQPSSLDVQVAATAESLNVVIPWSDRLFQYTSKHQARPARGALVAAGVPRPIGGTKPAWGVLDVGRGRWPYLTRWNWGGGAGTAEDGHTIVGLQLGGQWTVGTGFTENGVFVDGRLSKIGSELVWEYSWDEPMMPWRVRHPDGSLDLTLTPRYDRHDRTRAVLIATEVHQVFGSWSGRLTTDDGRQVQVAGIPGFAEESRSRW